MRPENRTTTARIASGIWSYLTPDPIGLAGGINPYVYVLNDPVNAVDPYGLAEQFDGLDLYTGCDCSKILPTAREKNNNPEYGYYGKFGPGPEKNKCNAFVDDVLASTNVQPRRWGGLGGPISAGTWADPKTNISYFPIVSDPQPGDIVAIAHNYSDASGHVAIVVIPGKSSIGAGAEGSHTTGWPWDKNTSPQGIPVYRRCTCK